MTLERSEHPARQRASIVAVMALAVPGVSLRLTGSHPEPAVAAVLFGIAIVGAAFMLAWSAEAAQLDLSQGLALAALAFIAVLPEYAVDLVFAWKAGKDPSNAPYALANMTGANRLLIGVGWSLVVLVAANRYRAKGMRVREVRLERSHAIEISFLAVATAYSLTLPLKRTLTLIDAAILVAIFVAYVVRISGSPAEEPHLVGPAQYLGNMPTPKRRAAVASLALVAGAVILACAEPFAAALLAAGEDLGIDKFLLVQWLAPLASEAPELLVALLFAWRLNTNAGLGALVSSKVNQWTLLVGTLPIVYAISSGGLHGLPLDALQREELFLTAAQSVFAVAVLANRCLSVRESLSLFGLFAVQFVAGAVLPESLRAVERIGVGVMYLALAVGVVLRDKRMLGALMHDGFRASITELAESPSVGQPQP